MKKTIILYTAGEDIDLNDIVVITKKNYTKCGTYDILPFNLDMLPLQVQNNPEILQELIRLSDENQIDLTDSFLSNLFTYGKVSVDDITVFWKDEDYFRDVDEVIDYLVNINAEEGIENTVDINDVVNWFCSDYDINEHIEESIRDYFSERVDAESYKHFILYL